MFKFFIVLHSFVLLASAKECKSGQNCELRCCTIPAGDVICRERCLGLSCELDVHCDGDCCVNSTCSSCLLKSSTRPSSQKPSKVAAETKTMMNRPTNNVHGCSRFNNQCPSGCCIDGQCVDSSHCVPIKAPRGGRGGGRGGGRATYKGSGGGGSGDGDMPAWGWAVIFGGIFLLTLCILIIKQSCCD
ncbi:Hypothetical predicted protein [Paramuricea clavata]|uniref:Uncharacterized protein n=1 Tax=Paramuricea clavata TaxID=317549 RepID=A0A6S7HMC6_PARCT|nr:Hypothetical predicted protein [Paramuricea clavata]